MDESPEAWCILLFAQHTWLVCGRGRIGTQASLGGRCRLCAPCVSEWLPQPWQVLRPGFSRAGSQVKGHVWALVTGIWGAQVLLLRNAFALAAVNSWLLQMPAAEASSLTSVTATSTGDQPGLSWLWKAAPGATQHTWEQLHDRNGQATSLRLLHLLISIVMCPSRVKLCCQEVMQVSGGRSSSSSSPLATASTPCCPLKLAPKLASPQSAD